MAWRYRYIYTLQVHADTVPCSCTLKKTSDTQLPWESWLPYIFSALDWESIGMGNVCTRNQEQNIWGMPVSFLRSWQLTSTANTASNSAVDMTIQYNLVSMTIQSGTLIRPMDELEMFVWLEILLVNYIQVHDLMFVYHTWCYIQTLHKPVVIARVCLWYVASLMGLHIINSYYPHIASLMGLYIYCTLVFGTSYAIYPYKSGPHDNTTVVLYMHLCIPRPHHIYV